MFAAMLIGSLLCCTACGQPEQPPQEDGLAAVEQLFRLDYSDVLLTVTDTFGEGLSLSAEYRLFPTEGGFTATYRVERFIDLSKEEKGGDSLRSDDPLRPVKRVISGSVAVQEGNVALIEGEEAGLPAALLGTGLSFREQFFENAELTGVFFRADVKDPSGFLGTPSAASGMKVEVAFLEVLLSLEITYTSEAGSAVVYEYEFNS